jgi:hypothetical protein
VGNSIGRVLERLLARELQSPIVNTKLIYKRGDYQEEFEIGACYYPGFGSGIEGHERRT